MNDYPIKKNDYKQTLVSLRPIIKSFFQIFEIKLPESEPGDRSPISSLILEGKRDISTIVSQWSSLFDSWYYYPELLTVENAIDALNKMGYDSNQILMLIDEYKSKLGNRLATAQIMTELLYNLGSKILNPITDRKLGEANTEDKLLDMIEAIGYIFIICRNDNQVIIDIINRIIITGKIMIISKDLQQSYESKGYRIDTNYPGLVSNVQKKINIPLDIKIQFQNLFSLVEYLGVNISGVFIDETNTMIKLMYDLDIYNVISGMIHMIVSDEIKHARQYRRFSYQGRNQLKYIIYDLYNIYQMVSKDSLNKLHGKLYRQMLVSIDNDFMSLYDVILS
jgi:hypothetical protein